MNKQEFLKEIGERIALIRRSKNITQADIAKEMGITQGIIASYEIGRRCIPLPKLMQLSDILGVGYDEIITGDIEYNKKKPGPKSKLDYQIEQLHDAPKNKQELVSQLLDQLLQ